MPPVEIVSAVLKRGGLIGPDDLLELRVALSQIPIDDVPEVEEAAYEALWLIVADPGYKGELTLADLERAQ